ncbi:hypothetical protein [Streptomyces mobaraensis]|uniref:Uncharacterized protein n=1 Tax=Streptomyces mobaraensis TaxID=35621 RepID=A0A5N5WEK5_STRMB|nr:hypothetical protein [Streptomyces mobaraensis]KAB7850147.1 hypothetical protein FRZ00_05985 [Streptomyces mobaraensis]
MPGRWRAELRPYLPPREAIDALCTGSVAMVGRGWAWITAEDWRAALRRLGYTGVTGYVVVYTAAHTPAAPYALPAGVLLWCCAAWMHAPAEAPRAHPVVQQPGDDTDAFDGPTEEPAVTALDPLEPDAFLDRLRTLIGDRNGVLLRTLVADLHEAGIPADWGVPEARSLCTSLGVPVKGAIKVAGETSVGVHRSALPAPPTPDLQETSDDR